jgi:hypothetical protein
MLVMPMQSFAAETQNIDHCSCAIPNVPSDQQQGEIDHIWLPQPRRENNTTFWV